MITSFARTPPGPGDIDPSQDPLSWIVDNFKRFGNIYKATVNGTDVFVVSDPHYADYILRENWKNYGKGRAIRRVGLLLGNGLIVSEGEFWKSQRRMIQPAFHQEAIGALVNTMTSASLTLAKKWESAAREKRTVNVTRDVSVVVLDVLLISIFGADYGQVVQPFGILSSESARDLRFAQAFRSLGKIVTEIACKRRKENRVSADILGVLMEARDRETGQAMPDPQLVSEIMNLIVAGHETTAGTVNWIWYLLAQNPDVEERLSREIDAFAGDRILDFQDLPQFAWTRQIVDEAMRLYPPVWQIPRKAIADDRLGDYAIPAGMEILVSPFLIQRNPALWDNPERFDPDRFDPSRAEGRHPLSMLPFGAGPRKCIGELFARIEMQIHIVTIAKSLRLRCLDTAPVELDAQVNLRSKHDFIMAPEIKASPLREARG